MLIGYTIVGLISFGAGIFFIVLLRRVSLRCNILVIKGIPHIGGIGISIAFLVTLIYIFGIYYGGIEREIAGIIISSTIMLILGIIDDLRELSVSKKFLIQIIATSLLVIFGIRTHIIFIGTPLNLVITFVWVLGITNAFNHLDVTDGVSAGSAIFSSLGLFIIALLNGGYKIAILSLSLTTAVLSCFIYNVPPAKIYMGNSGSHFLGFILAAIAISISYAPIDRKTALISPLLILGFPILDTLFLIWMRMKKGKVIFLKSNDHLALRFLQLGCSKNKTLLFMLSLSLFFTFLGVLLSQVSGFWGILIILLVVIVSVIVPSRMGKVHIDG